MLDGDFLDDRRLRWRAEGFDLSIIGAHLENSGGNISEAILHLERAMKISTNLRVRIERWPIAWPERNELLESLRDPTKIELNQRRWREIMRTKRPWVIVADSSKSSWSREGRSDELESWVERLETIDESMTPHSNEVMNAIENIAKKQDIEDLVLALEHRQFRRTQILEDMVTHLRSARGWDLTKLEGNLQQRYSEVSRVQEMDNILANIEDRVNEIITIFDKESAINLLEKAKLAQQMEDSNRLNELKIQSEKMSLEYIDRLEKVTTWLENLREKGYHISAPNNPQPSDLLILEKRVDIVNRDIKRLQSAWIRIDDLVNLFPEKTGVVAALQGQVERVDQIEELLANLEENRDEREQQSRSRISSWKSLGFKVQSLELLLDNAPRSGWLAIDEHAKKIRVCKELLETIDTIDVSFSGLENVNHWRQLLKEIDVDNEDYEKIRDGIAKQLRRNRWHREKLDESRIKLSTIWPSEINPFHLNLGEYEEYIIKLQSGQGVSNLDNSSRDNRLMLAAIAELDMWRQDGWDVSLLDSLLERDYVELWVQLPSIRKSISEYSKLKERLERLPLGRDPELLEEVKKKSSRPDHLTRLADSIPEIAKHLSSLPEKKSIEISLFEPTPPQVFAKLHPLKPILIPHIEDNLEPEKFIETGKEKISKNNYHNTLWHQISNNIGGDLDTSPRDFRVQRLVRILELLCPGDDVIDEITISLLIRLEKISTQLLKWSQQRLDRRHCSSDGNLLEISARLAEKLNEIPGPGIDLPRSFDEEELPKSGDLTAIEKEIKLLEKATFLPLAGSKSAVKVIS